MSEGIFARGSIPVLEKALAFRETRNDLLARNIANASTPGYRPVDLDEGEFHRLLREAVQAREEGHLRSFTLGPSDRFKERADGSLQAAPVALREGQVRHDGNAFNVEREMARLADNTIAHERTALLLAGSYKMIEMAIRGRSV